MSPVSKQRSAYTTEPPAEEISKGLFAAQSGAAPAVQANRDKVALETLRKDHLALKDKYHQSILQCMEVYASAEWLRFKFRLACAAVAFATILCAALIYTGGRH